MNLSNLPALIAEAKSGNYANLARMVYEVNKANGYWDKPRTSEECAVLVDTELSEVVEAYRKRKYADKEFLHLIGVAENYKEAYEDFIKDTFEAECAGTCIRLLDWMGHTGKCDVSIKFVVDELLTEFWKDMHWLKFTLLSHAKREHFAIRTLPMLIAFCEAHGVDLWRFVELELRYNAVRGHMRKQGKFA